MNKSRKNRWHNLDYPDNLLKAGYIEWKYFNFITPDFSGIFVYFIIDPLDITNVGGGRVMARIFTRGGVLGGVNKVPMTEVFPSKENAKITMGENSISVDGEVYRVIGKTNDVSWDLRYLPSTPSILGFSDLSVDPLHLEKISWLIKMPKANVIGTIEVKGKKFDINAMGYSDANWGELIPVVVRLNWAQYNDDAMSLVIGETKNLRIGKKELGRWSEVYVIYQNEIIKFAKKDIVQEHLEWSIVPGSKIKIPFITKIEAENKTYKLSVMLKTKISDPLYFNMPFSFPIRQVVVEQTASFRGELSKITDNKVITLHSIDGDGFKEHTLRNVSIRNKKHLGGGVVV